MLSAGLLFRSVATDNPLDITRNNGSCWGASVVDGRRLQWKGVVREPTELEFPNVTVCRCTTVVSEINTRGALWVRHLPFSIECFTRLAVKDPRYLASTTANRRHGSTWFKHSSRSCTVVRSNYPHVNSDEHVAPK